jgi:antibiotic biosynthesis monooxygenase (ABM) superfamily enzyme
VKPQRITCFLSALAVISLTACSTTNRTHHGSAKSDPETVLITYHVKSGKEAEFQAVLWRAWQIYRTEHLVFAEPHIILRDMEGDKTRFVEIFTWVSHAAPEHAPDIVTTVWEQEQSLCEGRNGHNGIEGGEVEILAGQ